MFRHACVNGNALLGTDDEILAEYTRSSACYVAAIELLTAESEATRDQIRQLYATITRNDNLIESGKLQLSESNYWARMYSSTTR